MRRDSIGRLWPERLVEHLVFWPLVTIGLIGVYFFARWLKELISPGAAIFAAWAVSIFGSWALVIFFLVLGLVVYVGFRFTSGQQAPPQ